MLLSGIIFKICVGVCLSSTLLLAECESEHDKAINAIQKAHQAKIANCEQHSNPQDCRDKAIEVTDAAITAFQQAWAATVAKNYQSKEEFKRGLIQEIMKIVNPVIREFLLRLVQEQIGPKNMNVSLLGQATISGIPVLIDSAILMGSTEQMEHAGLVHGDGRDSDIVSMPGVSPDPIQLINKIMNLSIDAEFELDGQTQAGTLTGAVIVQVGQGQTGPREIRVVSGTLTLDSQYAGMQGAPIIMAVKRGGRSSMTVLTGGRTVIRLDLDASSHPLSFTHDEKPFLEIPMIEAAADVFQVALASVPFEYIHVWQPWPVSDFNNDGQYDAADIAAFTQALAAQYSLTDLDMNGLYNADDLDLFLEYHAEDTERWHFQTDRFNND